jgi:hypothetical protein
MHQTVAHTTGERCKTTKQHDTNPLCLLRTVPGIGELLSLVLLYAIHDLQRFPACNWTSAATP